jgi:uncharacterized protein YoxC
MIVGTMKDISKSTWAALCLTVLMSFGGSYYNTTNQGLQDHTNLKVVQSDVATLKTKMSNVVPRIHVLESGANTTKYRIDALAEANAQLTVSVSDSMNLFTASSSRANTQIESLQAVTNELSKTNRALRDTVTRLDERSILN